mmetsp:Transcript_37303/g.107775  ORF Transcript_37303/g.107775 Transcript_37303/m.107775 type:complete len:304 (+) Transcript_37303:595-1506(+)
MPLLLVRIDFVADEERHLRRRGPKHERADCDVGLVQRTDKGQLCHLFPRGRRSRGRRWHVGLVHDSQRIPLPRAAVDMAVGESVHVSRGTSGEHNGARRRGQRRRLGVLLGTELRVLVALDLSVVEAAFRFGPQPPRFVQAGHGGLHGIEVRRLPKPRHRARRRLLQLRRRLLHDSAQLPAMPEAAVLATAAVWRAWGAALAAAELAAAALVWRAAEANDVVEHVAFAARSSERTGLVRGCVRRHRRLGATNCAAARRLGGEAAAQDIPHVMPAAPSLRALAPVAAAGGLDGGLGPANRRMPM